MKHPFLALAGLLIASAFQATSAAEHSIMLTVKKLSGKSDMTHTREIAPARQWKEAGNGGMRWLGRPVEIDFISANETLEITMMNASPSNDSFILEYLFFKQDQGDKTELLSKRQKVPMAVAAGDSQSITAVSPVLKYSTDSVQVNGKAVKLGEKPYGWVVVLRDSAGVFKSAASSEYAREIQNPKKLDLLLEKYPAAAERPPAIPNKFPDRPFPPRRPPN
jgi:hypothetical protein